MTIPMDKGSERVHRLYKKNTELENGRRKAAQARIPSNPNAWQQMRENYEAILLEDHAFSEQHEIEYALWQLHHRRIEELRSHLTAAVASSSVQNGKRTLRPGPDRETKIRSQFKTFLSEATGFYHDLMVKIRAKYGLPLGYVSDNSGNQIALSKDGNKSAELKKGLVSCHRCLVYLGDLARYKGIYGEGDSKTRDFVAASSYYLEASSLWPSSGNPHHQLAILASYSGDELVAIYRYFRSLAVDNPFATARDNLIIAFEKNRHSYSQMFGDAQASFVKMESVRITGKGRGRGETRLPSKDSVVGASVVKAKASGIPETFKAFSIRFVRLNGILFTRTSLETFEEVFSSVKIDLLELLSSGPEEEYNFSSDATDCRLVIVRLIAILIFTIHNVNRETENQSYAEILQRSVLLQKAVTAIFEFMGHILERCIQLNDPSASYLLPGIMLFVEWLACHQNIALGSELEEKQASARSLFWNHCISFFNKLLSNGFTAVSEDEDEICFFNMSRYDEGETTNRLALPEDFELRGFVPLLPAQLILDFSWKHSLGSNDGNKKKKANIQRIIAAGKSLANVVHVGQQGIHFDRKSQRFVIGNDPHMFDDYSLTNSLGIPTLNGAWNETPFENRMDLEVKPKAELYLEGEEEEEVIVFKPSLNEKFADGMALNKNSEFLASGISASKVDFGNEVGTFSTSRDGLHVQDAFGTGSRARESVANTTAQYLKPIQPSTSKWLTEHQGSITNGLVNLHLLENGIPLKPELQGGHIGVLQPADFSVPFPQSANVAAGNSHSLLAPETAVLSNFDSIMSSGAGFDRLSMQPSPLVSAGLKKSPVSRPVRHFGPPPGFGSVPPKAVDESLSGMTMKNKNPPIDDYSWLDGYQLPSTQIGGFNNSNNHSAPTYHPVNKSNSSMGMVSFPFPGKQISTLQVQMENLKDRQLYQFPENLKLYLEHEHQLRKGNQQSTLPQ